MCAFPHSFVLARLGEMLFPLADLEAALDLPESMLTFMSNASV
jgi:hypothetical protein